MYVEYEDYPVFIDVLVGCLDCAVPFRRYGLSQILSQQARLQGGWSSQQRDRIAVETAVRQVYTESEARKRREEERMKKERMKALRVSFKKKQTPLSNPLL